MLVTFGDIILNVPATKIILLSRPTCNPLIVIKIKIMLIAIIVADFCCESVNVFLFRNVLAEVVAATKNNSWLFGTCK